jgi:hypothetical protein
VRRDTDRRKSPRDLERTRLLKPTEVGGVRDSQELAQRLCHAPPQELDVRLLELIDDPLGLEWLALNGLNSRRTADTKVELVPIQG